MSYEKKITKKTSFIETPKNSMETNTDENLCTEFKALVNKFEIKKISKKTSFVENSMEINTDENLSNESKISINSYETKKITKKTSFDDKANFSNEILMEKDLSICSTPKENPANDFSANNCILPTIWREFSKKYETKKQYTNNPSMGKQNFLTLS